MNTLLEQALALPESERDAWLQALPVEHRTLAPMLRAMLIRASVETDTFMRKPVGLLADAFDDESEASEHAGDTIGPYRLLHPIGSGGMATVWLATRADGELRRQVALKLPRSGWTSGLAQRMARERDILAALEHPRIARLYDAGTTPEGRPWLAMERIDGVTIDQHCREHQLDVAARLRLVPAGGRRGGARARAPDRAPRLEAQQHPGHAAGRGEAAGLRCGQAAGGRPAAGEQPDAADRPCGDAGLRVARAGGRACGHGGHRRLFARRGAVRAAHRRAAVSSGTTPSRRARAGDSRGAGDAGQRPGRQRALRARPAR